MLLCKNCNKQFDDDSTFCDECGSSLISVVSCPACNNLVDTENGFCNICGTDFSCSTESSEPKHKKTKLVKKLLAIGIPCIAVILAITIISLLFVKKQKSENYVFYVKNGEIWFSHTLGIKPREITDNLDASGDMTKEDFNALGSPYANRFFQLSENGSHIFFIDEVDTEEDDGYTLYYRSANNPNAMAKEIDDDIWVYSVSNNGRRVTYLKDYDYDESIEKSYGTLYQSNLRDSDKIANDVTGFFASENGKIIYYTTTDDDLYRVDGNKKDKLSGDVTDICYVDDKYETVYYLEEDVLFKQEKDSKAKEIVSDVYDVLAIYDSGEVYYTTNSSANASLIDYVEDDMLETDAAMTAPTPPVKPVYPSYYDYDSYAQYSKARDAYDVALDKYNAEYNDYRNKYTAYQEKLNRDAIRSELKYAPEIGVSAKSLYYYNGDESVLVSDAYSTEGDFYSDGSEWALDSAVLVFKCYDKTNVEKIKLSSVDSISEIQNLVDSALTSSYSYCVAAGKNTMLIDREGATNFFVDELGESVYFFDYIDEEKRVGNLYYIHVSGNEISKPEYFEGDVYTGSCGFYADGKFMYYKDYNTEKHYGELYINGKKVDDDVYSCRYVEETDTVVYITDYSTKNKCGTLNTYYKGKNTEIGDDVHQFSITKGGEIIYLCDYDLDDYEGELYVYRNNKSKFIDDEVNCIIPYSYYYY